MAGGGALVTRLSYGLALLQRTSPRRISTPRPRAQPNPSPPAAPVRRASVAILLRVRPNNQDEQALAKQYGYDGRPFPSAGAAPILPQLRQRKPICTDPAAQSMQIPCMTGHGTARHSAQSGTGIGAAAPHVLRTFFDLPWVRRGTPEMFFIKRAARAGDNWSAQVAFPGGRREDRDESGVRTALRETWEETGIDLTESNGFVCMGQLDDREITSNLGSKLLMILSPYVFLQTSPFSSHPTLAASEVASSHWIPLTLLDSPAPEAWGTLTVDVTNRLAPKTPLMRSLLHALVGDMVYRSLFLPNQPVVEASDTDADSGALSPQSAALSAQARDGLSSDITQGTSKAQDSPDYPVDALTHPHLAPAARGPHACAKQPIYQDRPPLQLWGLTLGMTLDFLSRIPSSTLATPTPSSPQLSSSGHSFRSLSWLGDVARIHSPWACWRQAPRFAAAFPRFSHLDVNVWIWVFGSHYRRLVADWAEQIAASNQNAHKAWDALCNQEATPSVRPRPGGQPRCSGQRVGAAELALGAYYTAVRRALLASIVLRGIGAVLVAGVGTVVVFRRWAQQPQE